MSFDCFRWLTSVENIYIDAIIFTLSDFLSGIVPFQCSPPWLGRWQFLAAIMDLRTPIEIYMTLDCFNGSAMVINLCIDANIFTLDAFLSEIEPFYWCLFWPGGHFESTGDKFTIHVFWLFHAVDQGQKHTPRCYYFYSKCIFKWDTVISMFPPWLGQWSFWRPSWIWGPPLRFTWLLTVLMDPPWSKTYA